MDFDQYLQCLDYMSKQTAASKAWFQEIMPSINVFAGVIVGFMLNKLSDLLKDRRNTNNKIKVIREEIRRTKEIFCGTYKEAVRLADISIAGKDTDIWNLPSQIKLSCISEFFVPLSYKFTEPERVSIFYLISCTEALNHFLMDFMKGETQPKSSKELGNMAMNLLGTSSTCYYLCADFQGNTRNTQPIPLTALAGELGLSESPIIQTLNKNLHM